MSPTVEKLPDLKGGQAWSIKSPAPPIAKIVIGHIENWCGNEIIHISVIDIPIVGCDGRSLQTIVLGHAPFEKTALVFSLDKFITDRHRPAEDILDSIKQRRAASGGAWTGRVTDVLKLVF